MRKLLRVSRKMMFVKYNSTIILTTNGKSCRKGGTHNFIFINLL